MITSSTPPENVPTHFHCSCCCCYLPARIECIANTGKAKGSIKWMNAELFSSLYESACQNYLLLLLQTNYVPAWAGIEPVLASLPLDLVSCSISHTTLERLNPERVMKFCTHVVNICKTRSDVGVMFHIFSWYPYLHKSKIAAVGHPKF